MATSSFQTPKLAWEELNNTVVKKNCTGVIFADYCRREPLVSPRLNLRVNRKLHVVCIQANEGYLLVHSWAWISGSTPNPPLVETLAVP